MTIQRGEMYFVNVNPVQGREQAEQRPVLVLSIDAINRLPLVATVVVGMMGKDPTRLPNQCPGSARRQWPADGDSLPLLPNTVLGSTTFSSYPRGETQRSPIGAGRTSRSLLPWLVVSPILHRLSTLPVG
jgi:PemK-like, MazF-like toxin of type II toxin-antitoxin system